MNDLFVDTSVFLLAVGGTHPNREPCREFLAAATERNVVLHASVEAVQEFLFHRMRRVDRALAVRQTHAVRKSVVLHPFDEAVLDESLRLIETTPLRGRDAVHAATALVTGHDRIVSLDSDFDGLDAIRRVDPATAW